jgi:hypothetical protein
MMNRGIRRLDATLSHLVKMTWFEREFEYAAFYNINDSVLSRVWYVVLLGLVTKAARLLNIIGWYAQISWTLTYHITVPAARRGAALFVLVAIVADALSGLAEVDVNTVEQFATRTDELAGDLLAHFLTFQTLACGSRGLEDIGRPLLSLHRQGLEELEHFVFPRHGSLRLKVEKV